jgi:gliding motility-associated-like protein
VQSCYIAVPSGFTPNGDGINDYLYPLNAYKAINLEFRVYNRYGQLVFETKNWMNKWDGTINGKQQPTGTYVWMLNYTDSDSGKKYFLKGTSVLIR